jgi:hypothetical protein
MLSSTIHVIYKCVPLLLIIKRIIPTKQLCIKIRYVSLQQRHDMGHCQRYHRQWRIVSLGKHLLSGLQQVLLGFLLIAKSLQLAMGIPLLNHQLIKSSWHGSNSRLVVVEDTWTTLRSSLRVAVEAQTACRSRVKVELDSWVARSAWSATCREGLSSTSALLTASSLAVKATRRHEELSQ